MMEFTDLIKKISQDTRLKPDLLKAKNGNNFRAVSESTILDVIDPILREAGWFYTITVKKSDLQIKEAYGSKGKKLQFIATVEIALDFETYQIPLLEGSVHTEAVGMGIDDNDKAMGKAYTYAVKYALLKLFRLRFGDDSDFEESEPLLLEKNDKTEKSSKKETENDNITRKSGHKSKNEKTSDKAMSEAQRDYILGMMKKKGVTSRMIMDKFDGHDPEEDEYVPMTVARAMIKYLETADDLPF